MTLRRMLTPRVRIPDDGQTIEFERFGTGILGEPQREVLAYPVDCEVVGGEPQAGIPALWDQGGVGGFRRRPEVVKEPLHIRVGVVGVFDPVDGNAVDSRGGSGYS